MKRIVTAKANALLESAAQFNTNKKFRALSCWKNRLICRNAPRIY
jgi:hypothetical protein